MLRRLSRRRFPVARSGRRLHWMVLALGLGLALCLGRAFQLQALESKAYADKATKQMTQTQVLLPQRGSLLDRNGQVLATTQPAVDIVADPLMIQRNGIAIGRSLTASEQAAGDAAPAAIAAVLVHRLGGKASDYLPALTARKGGTGDLLGWSVVKRHVPTWIYSQIRDDLAKGGSAGGHTVRAWYGLLKQDDPVRVYPAGGVGADVVGFMANGAGGGGLEYGLDSQLKGTEGRESYETSAYGRIPMGSQTLVPAVNGNSYTLTLDSEMQLFAQNALAAQVKAAQARSGTAIVMNVKTGELLAMASAPSFDPNDISKAAPANLTNRAVTMTYEPGSVEKVLTMASLADQGLVTPDTHVVVPSRIQSGSGYINDAESHGTWYLTARGVIAESSNIGMTELARQGNTQQLVNHLSSFGLGTTTGTGLPGESSGYLPSASMPDYTRDQVAFGQGLSVTAVQMAAAIAAVANGGVYNPPTIIKSGVDGNGAALTINHPAPHRVISQQAANETLDMMEAVITQIGGGKREIPNYRMVGKSGTAQAIGSKGTYDGYVSSFVGVAPAENPQLLVYVVLDHPNAATAHQGAAVALPVVRELMKLGLPRYGVAPSTTAPRKETVFYRDGPF